MTENDLLAIQKDVLRARENGRLDVDELGRLVLPGGNMRIGGEFSFEHKRHELVQDAIERNDPEREAWMRAFIRRNGDVQMKRNYVTVANERKHNMIPDAAINFALSLLLFPSRTKINTWYAGLFTSNWSPSETTKSDWAASLATELQQAQFDESGRQPLVFGTAASSKTIATTTPTTFTISAGVVGLLIYGITLNEISTVDYAGTDRITLAATRFQSPKTVDEGDLANSGYQLNGASG
jgi:hypothetical protein